MLESVLKFVEQFGEWLLENIAHLPQEDASTAIQLLAVGALYVILSIRAAHRANLDAIDAGPKENTNGPIRSALTDRQDELNVRGFARYQANVQQLLNQMALFVGDAYDASQERFDTPPRGGRTPALKFTNGSAQSYLFAVGLATLYPILLLFGNWAVADDAAAFGPFITSGNKQGTLLFEALAVGTMVVLLWYSFPVSRRSPSTQIAFGVFAGLTLLTLIQFPNAPMLAFVPAFIGALFAQGPLAAAMAWFIATAVVAIMFAGNSAATYLGAVLTPAIAVGVFRLTHRWDRSRLKRVLLVLAWVFSIGCAAAFATLLRENPAHQSYLDFGVHLYAVVILVCVLPFSNAICDWASLWFTRLCLLQIVEIKSKLGKRVDGKPRSRLGQFAGFCHDWGLAFLWFVADVCAALLLSVVVTYFAVLCVHFFVQWAPPPSGIAEDFDVAKIVRDMIENPLEQKNLWVFAMLYSTLVPTIAHLIVAIYSIVQTIPLVDFQELAGKLATNGHHTDQRRAMALQMTFVQAADDFISATLFALTMILLAAMLELGVPFDMGSWIAWAAERALQVSL